MDQLQRGKRYRLTVRSSGTNETETIEECSYLGDSTFWFPSSGGNSIEKATPTFFDEQNDRHIVVSKDDIVAFEVL